MAISGVGSDSLSSLLGNLAPVVKSTQTSSTASTVNSPASSASTPASNTGTLQDKSVMAAALMQSLQQFSAGSSISSLFSDTEDSQSSGNQFLSQLYAAMPEVQGMPSGKTGGANVYAKPAQLNTGSPTYPLQQGIQKLISQLEQGSGDQANPLLSNLQSSFNTLIKASGGNPQQGDLQSFLKLVATQVQGSLSVGSLFSASA